MKAKYNCVLQWLCVPFAMLNEAVTSIAETATVPGGWVGELTADYSLAVWFDLSLMLIFGVLPLQVPVSTLQINLPGTIGRFFNLLRFILYCKFYI